MGHLESVDHNYQHNPLRRPGGCLFFCYTGEDTDVQLERLNELILRTTQLIGGKIKPSIPKS